MLAARSSPCGYCCPALQKQGSKAGGSSARRQRLIYLPFDASDRSKKVKTGGRVQTSLLFIVTKLRFTIQEETSVFLCSTIKKSFNFEDSARLSASFIGSAVTRWLPFGSSTVMVVPFPSMLRTFIAPLWSFTI